MEIVHRSANRAWIDDSVINLKQFLDDWIYALSFPKTDTGVNYECLKNYVSKEEALSTVKMCELEIMKSKYQHFVESSDNVHLFPDVNLATLELQSADLKKRRESNKYTCAVYHTQKFCNFPPHQTVSSQIDISKLPHNPLTYPDVILNVQIFLPDRRVDAKATNSGYTKLPMFQLDQEFLVYGGQYLTELRDKIACISDKAIPGEYSDFPMEEPAITCKDLYKSGFFYINGVFYNDMRDKDCRDYSESIINWASSGKRLIGPFRKALMEKTRFIDLTIQLGYPYVYTHQGECEHLIVFSNLRLLSEHEDINNRNAYPWYVQAKDTKRIFCMICHEYAASWVVYENKRLPENPFFFCKTCFLNFNYDINNQKIGDFKAYHYPDNTKLLIK